MPQPPGPTVAPLFNIPLSDSELVLLGKIAVLWGRIDEGFDVVFRSVLQIDTALYQKAFGDKMIGARLALFKLALGQISDPSVKSECELFCDALEVVIPDRNTAMHSLWGLYALDPTYRNFKTGALNRQKPKVRFYADQLATLHDRLAELTNLLSRLVLHLVSPGDPPQGGNTYYFAPSPPDGRAHGVTFLRGDVIVPVESNEPGWRTRQSPSTPQGHGGAGE